MTDRTPVPEALAWAEAEIRHQMIENGYGDLIELDDAYREVDTAAIKRLAHETYGTPADLTTADSASKDPTVPYQGNPGLSTSLNDMGIRIHDRMFSTLGRQWEGDAFEAFVAYDEELRGVTILEGNRLAFIGKVMVEMADAIEQHKIDSKLTFLGAAGLWLSAGGLATAGTSPFGLSNSVAGGLSSILSVMEQKATALEEKLAALEEAYVEMTGPLTSGIAPIDIVSAFPDDLDDWDVIE